MLLIMTVAQVGASVVQQGFGSLAPFVVSHFHLNKAGLGLIFTALITGCALTVALGGMAVDRFGERRVTLISGLGIGACLCLAAVSPTYGWLLASFFLLGLVYSPLPPAGGRAILNWFDRDRAVAMAVRQSGVPIGAFIGALLLPAIALHFDFRIALFAGAALAIVGTAILPMFYRDPADVAAPPRGLATFRDGIQAIVTDRRALYCSITCMTLGATQQVSAGFLALSAVVLAHAGIATAALVFAASQIAGTVGRIAWGWASDHVFDGDRMLPLAFICGIAAAGSLWLAFATPGNVMLLFVCAVLIGGSAAAWNGLYATALVEIAGSRFAGSALGLGLTSVFIAAAIVPFFFGALADARGLAVAWICIAGICALAAIPALLAKREFKRALDGVEGRRAAHG